MSASIKPTLNIRQRLNERFRQWVNRRQQPARKQQLNNKNLYIFPSMAGFGFLFVNLLMWLMGTNYENNMVLGLAYFMVALLVISIHHTFFNMSGLTLEYLKSAPCYAGEQGEVEVLVSCPQTQEKENIVLQYPHGSEVRVNLLEDKQVRVKLFVDTPRRGWFEPGRITVSSRFPLGIIRCWSYPHLDARILVYPKPLAGIEMPVSGAGSEAEGNVLDDSGSEDFNGFKRHHDGMSPRHIAWKQYARGQQLLSKEYVAYREQKLWLDWDALDGMGREQRLSVLCYWVLKISATQQPFGLRLPGVSFDPDTGIEHKQQLLKALALFEG
ncbi:DUF58 domain-containing protein [Candidatus Pelagadaptatus aseana]|uniref:DUF58 domain-containing protein n=1 Tax=Candidatus Pelagadaptatus aseana TaxID=3120508 RepID=UPI003C703B71